jgi:Ni,Fe-hydrogenase III small subunit/NAD-dependent dihydropyrimidine dehydrogenase PreA subunit
MLKSIRVRMSQGEQFVRDLRAARPSGFRGLPVVDEGPCGAGCDACRDACPTEALRGDPLTVDLGRCVFCGACEEECPDGRIRFTNNPRMAARTPEELVVTSTAAPNVVEDGAIAKLFGRSLKMRQVSAGGCNGCELELNALANVNFDVQRFGIEWVASPRHADALVLTGPLTTNMARATQLAWEAMPDPKFVVAFGACAISGGLYERSEELNRQFLVDNKPVLYVPGCPPHPLTFAHAILDLLGR